MKKLISIILMLALASPASAASVYVRQGDTLWQIAQKHGTTVDAIVQANGIADRNLIHVGQVLEVDGVLGANIPIIVALYTDSLASRISSSASSFTLTRGTDKQSRNLSGIYGFVVDEGTTSEEFMTATCSGTTCTVIARGIDVVDGSSEVTALKFEHRRGATVKISNFPQLAILSRILNGQENASSTFRFGDGSTTTTLYKVIKADNGTANLPFIRYNETIAKWQVSDDGTNTVTVASSSAAGLSASTTKSVFITDSYIGVNSSSTGGIYSDSGGLLAFSGVVNTSTIHNGVTTFTGAATSTAKFSVSMAPTDPNSVVNKAYEDNQLGFFTGTGTAGMAITAGRALYASPTSSLLHTDTSNNTSTFHFVGIALEDASTGGTVRYSRPGGISCNQSGLTPGAAVFLNGTAGQISSTAAAKLAKVGTAMSSTCLQIADPKYSLTGSRAISGTGSNFEATGFYPSRITIMAGPDSTNSSGGSIGFEAGFLRFDLQSANNAAVAIASSTPAYTCRDINITTTECMGNVSSRNESGFYVQVGTAAVAHTYIWTAESE